MLSQQTRTAKKQIQTEIIRTFAALHDALKAARDVHVLAGYRAVQKGLVLLVVFGQVSGAACYPAAAFTDNMCAG